MKYVHCPAILYVTAPPPVNAVVNTIVLDDAAMSALMVCKGPVERVPESHQLVALAIGIGRVVPRVTDVVFGPGDLVTIISIKT